MSTKPLAIVSRLVIAAALAGPLPAQAGSRAGIYLKPLGSYREQSATPGVCRRNIAETGGYDPLRARLRMGCWFGAAVVEARDVEPREPWPDGRDRAQEQALSHR
ncbi:MAG: hypothetical protein AB7I59_05140, partial [Geminicoccaceae bacterium]